jgi:hypothetical protein
MVTFFNILDDTSYLLNQIENQIYIDYSKLTHFEISNLKNLLGINRHTPYLKKV